MRCPVLTLVVAAICFIYIASGTRYGKKYRYHKHFPYTPPDAESIPAYLKMVENLQNQAFDQEFKLIILAKTDE